MYPIALVIPAVLYPDRFLYPALSPGKQVGDKVGLAYTAEKEFVVFVNREPVLWTVPLRKESGAPLLSDAMVRFRIYSAVERKLVFFRQESSFARCIQFGVHRCIR